MSTIASPLRDGESTGSGATIMQAAVSIRSLSSLGGILFAFLSSWDSPDGRRPGPSCRYYATCCKPARAQTGRFRRMEPRHDACFPPAGGCRWFSVDHGRTSSAGQVFQVITRLTSSVSAPETAASCSGVRPRLAPAPAGSLAGGCAPPRPACGPQPFQHRGARKRGRAAPPCRKGLRGLMRAGHSGKGRGAPLPEQGLELRRRGALPLEHPQGQRGLRPHARVLVAL